MIAEKGFEETMKEGEVLMDSFYAYNGDLISLKNILENQLELIKTLKKKNDYLQREVSDLRSRERLFIPLK